MISVQNLQRQSNGSSLPIIFCLLFLFSSCELFRPVQKPTGKDKEKEEELDPIGGGRVYNPETGEFETSDEVLVEKLDTIRWRDVSTSEYPPITTEGVATNSGDGGSGVVEEGEFGSLKLNSYNVSMMLPFLTDRFNGDDRNLDGNSRWAVQFYTGAKIAVKKLDEEGINLKLSAYDTRASQLALNETLQRDTGFIQNSHLIIGTVKGECVVRMAEYAKQQQIPFVSPFSASTRITQQNPNPFYIQINPSITTHLRAITSHAKSKYNSDQIVVVAQKGDQSEGMMRYIQDLNYELAGSTYAPKLEELVIDDDSPNLERTDINSVIKSGRETVFILPMWRNKDFIYAFLRKAYLASRYNTVVIYGMRQWQYYQDANYNYYENLNLHISSEYYVDNYADEVRDFKKAYFEEYGTVPGAEAIRGYDNMLYFGRMLAKYGTKFYEFFNREQLDGFHTTYVLEPVARIEKNNYGQEVYGDPERFENQFIHILKFEDFYFQPAE